MSPWLVWMVELSFVKRSRRMSFNLPMPSLIFQSSSLTFFSLSAINCYYILQLCTKRHLLIHLGRLLVYVYRHLANPRIQCTLMQLQIIAKIENIVRPVRSARVFKSAKYKPLIMAVDEQIHLNTQFIQCWLICTLTSLIAITLTSLSQLQYQDIRMLYKQSQPKIRYQKFEEKDYFPFKHQGFATLAVHAAQEPEPIHGSVNIPIHLSSTYAQRDIAQPYGKFDYTRGGNPTRDALQQCLAAVEYGKKAITFTSGTGAFSTFFHILSKGDHILATEDIYGGIYTYITKFLTQYQGVIAQFVDMTGDLSVVQKAIKPETKVIWVEALTNPNIRVIDLAGLCQRVKKINPNIIIVVDNTFSSPYISSPLLLGADVVLHSLSKYIAGHTDLLMGALVFKDEELYKQVYFAAYSLGANPSPFDCYLSLRGIKTLECRMLQATSNAYHIAHFLEKHEAVESVFYPGLKSNKFHELAKQQMRGFGGMLSFKVKGNSKNAAKCVNSLKLIIPTVSLGGVHSTLCISGRTTHKMFSPQLLTKLDITENLLRYSVGVESLDDLIQDLDQALAKSQLQE